MRLKVADQTYDACCILVDMSKNFMVRTVKATPHLACDGQDFPIAMIGPEMFVTWFPYRFVCIQRY